MKAVCLVHLKTFKLLSRSFFFSSLSSFSCFFSCYFFCSFFSNNFFSYFRLRSVFCFNCFRFCFVYSSFSFQCSSFLISFCFCKTFTFTCNFCIFLSQPHVEFLFNLCFCQSSFCNPLNQVIF